MWQRKWDEHKLLQTLSYRPFVTASLSDPKDRQKRRCFLDARRKGWVDLTFTPIEIVAKLSPAKQHLHLKRGCNRPKSV